MSFDRPERPGPLSGPGDEDAEVFARFAELVSRSAGREDVPAEPAALQRDWSASLQFIRDVGEKLRETQRRSELMTRNAVEIARKAVAAMNEARERATLAEADAAAAMARARAAEDELLALRREHPPQEPLLAGVDQWLHQAHLQLQMAREGRSER